MTSGHLGKMGSAGIPADGEVWAIWGDLERRGTADWSMDDAPFYGDAYADEASAFAALDEAARVVEARYLDGYAERGFDHAYVYVEKSVFKGGSDVADGGYEKVIDWQYIDGRWER